MIAQTDITLIYFSTNYDYFSPTHTFIVNMTKLILGVTKMISMTNFDSSKTVKQWLYILEK